MRITLTDRLKNAWNAFTSRDPTYMRSFPGSGSYDRPDRRRPSNIISNDGSIIEMIKNRIAVDAAQIDIKHVRTDDEGNFKEELDSSLNEVFQVSANVDQSGRAFFLDLIYSLLDEGKVAAVLVDTDMDPYITSSYEVYSMRVGKIVSWYPYHVLVEVYDERTGKKKQIPFPKETTAIIENPFYSIMNAPNSTLQRLIRTLRNLDVLNEQNASGKLDLIIQLPYSLKSPIKQQQAESRRKQIEMQLSGSQYGIAYIDAAEHVTQLNRSLENNLWKEASDLTAILYNQLGLTQSVFDGTANEATLNNYYIRTIYPILAAVTEEMNRKFLSKTARSKNQRITYIKDPFRFIGMSEMATVIQTLNQNAIISSNEGRSKIGLPPVKSEQADVLANKNINKIEDMQNASVGSTNDTEEPVNSDGKDSDEENQNEAETSNKKEEINSG